VTVLLLFAQCKMHYWWLVTWLDLTRHHYWEGPNLQIRSPSRRCRCIQEIQRGASSIHHSLGNTILKSAQAACSCNVFYHLEPESHAVPQWCDCTGIYIPVHVLVYNVRSGTKVASGIDRRHDTSIIYSPSRDFE
jgi:hypothetical protein